MNVQSNVYTFIYATVLVIVVALGLAFTSISLKSKQNENIDMEKKQNILASIGIKGSRSEAVKSYEQYVKDEYAIDYDGNKIDGVDAFAIDLKAEQTKVVEDRQYPVYECEIAGKSLYVFPLLGKGLWGPIWGYVALESDFNTVSGVIFDHKSETPGLGAEIATADFQKRFVGKKIFDDTDKFVSILVEKPSKADVNDPHQVAGLSGATLTCNGLKDMLKNSLGAYVNFFKAHQKQS